MSKLDKYNFEGTYSPEDNKLRIYASERLERELYLKFVDKGFRWAPKQKLFVAPMWTPSRRDFLISVCGFVQDELTSVEERAEQRAKRFEGYHSNRIKDANSFYNESKRLADNVPMGQPIHVGHHSQKMAEKQANKIEKSMENAVMMWDRSEYWESRIKGVLSNSKYKERQDVRLRRIKKLEAEKRKYEKYTKESVDFISLWSDPTKEMNLERARAIANYDRQISYSKIVDLEITAEQAQTQAIENHEKIVSFYADWVNHSTLRINYENSILKAEGYIEPEKVKRKLAPLVNYDHEKAVKITKEQFKKIRSDSRYCKKIGFDGEFDSYRVRKVSRIDLHRLGLIEKPSNYWENESIFITDQKIIERPLAKGEAC